MHLSFTFNSRTSAIADRSDEANLMIVRMTEEHINDLIKYRGYIYLNQIYEMFGVEWNPEWENLCLTRSEPGCRITVAIARSNEDGYDLDIL